MDPGPISIILLSPIYFSRTVYFTRILILFSTRYTHNLCFKQTGEIDNLIVSWEQSICLCVCAGSALLLAEDESTSIVNGALVGVLLSQSASPSVIIVSPLLIDKPRFLN
jgi:hypothetical protein